MKEKIINGVIWLAIAGIVIFWTWFLEWMSPGTPFQAFFASLLIATPITIYIIILLMAIFIKIERGDPLWEWHEPKPRKLPLWYRILSIFFR